MGKHVLFEACRSLLRLFSSYRRGDGVDDGKGEVFLDEDEGLVGIGIQRVYLRRAGIAGGYAVTVEDEVHRPVVRPLHHHFLADGLQVVALGCLLCPSCEWQQDGKQQTIQNTRLPALNRDFSYYPILHTRTLLSFLSYFSLFGCKDRKISAIGKHSCLFVSLPSRFFDDFHPKCRIPASEIMKISTKKSGMEAKNTRRSRHIAE